MICLMFYKNVRADTLIFNIPETDEGCQINLNYGLSNLNKWLKMNEIKQKL